jgi:hypothetical protein
VPSPRPETIVASRTITINRAPVLTLWAAVVAELLGFDRDEALTLGRAVAGLNAQSKGRRLGIFKPHEKATAKARKTDRGKRFKVELLGRAVPVVNTPEGIRAVSRSKPIEPGAVEDYLADKFGDDLPAVRSAMLKLARQYKRAELADAAYELYEHFRPAVPAGTKGWGAKGRLDLGVLDRLKPRE